MALFGKAKTGETRNQMLSLFSHIVKETKSAVGYALAPQSMVDKSEKYEPGLVSVNPNVPADVTGNVQVKATDKGLKAFDELTGLQAGGATEQAAPEAEKPTFVLEEGFAPRAAKRGGIRESLYPFDKMKVGASFFVAATDAQPAPHKTLGSTVSSANKRYAATYPIYKGKAVNGARPLHPKSGQTTGKDGRTFTVRAVTVADGEKSNGARVYRIK